MHDIRALERGAAFPCCVSASHGPSRAFDEPVNPRKREGESSPVNAEVMTGVATLKDPRQSAIAGTVSRSSSLSPSPPPLSFTRLHVSSATRLPSLLPLTAGLDDTRVPHRAVNHGRWEAERPICPAAPKTKIANPKKRRPSYLHRDFRESFLPR